MKPAWVPTRLLEILDESSTMIRLIETQEMDDHEPYCTLSHCWGSVSLLKLTRKTASVFANGVHTHQLPLTFQQAIEVCRRLHVSYIWIDSLCIYQDDDDRSDWLREGLLMNKVYANTYLNIAATDAIDSTKGLFRERDPAFELRPTVIDLQSPETPDWQEFVLNDFFYLQRNLASAPLNRRAWVLQERLLAPRVLHFGSTQVYWECQGGTTCERWPRNLPISIMKVLPSASFKSRNRANSIHELLGHEKPRGSPYDEAFGLWQGYIDAYSRASLTFQGDKAIALSGIANAMIDLYGDEYIAGMWKSRLPNQLLWEVSNTRQANGHPSMRPLPYRAPTWSWLSMEGMITKGIDPGVAIAIEVLDVQMQYATPDPTGPILGGSLTLKACLRSMRLRKLFIRLEDIMNAEEIAKFEHSGRTRNEVESWLKGQWIMTVGGQDLRTSEEVFHKRSSPLVSLDVEVDDFEKANTEGELFVISAGISTAETKPFHHNLLIRCIDKKRGLYHRFGTAALSVKAGSRWISNMLFGHDEDEASIPCISYDAQARMHTIIME